MRAAVGRERLGAGDDRVPVVLRCTGHRSRAPPTSPRGPASSRGRGRCSRPGTGRGTSPQPEHSSGMMITSIPWLKMAPNCGGQWRMHVSQLMQIDMSISSGAVLPLRVALAVGETLARRSAVPHRRQRRRRPDPIDPPVKCGGLDYTVIAMPDDPTGGSPTRASSASSSCSTPPPSCSPSAATPRRGCSTSAARPAWPRASSTGTSRPRKRCSASWPPTCASGCARSRPRRWTRRPIRSCRSARAPRPASASWPPTPGPSPSMAVENVDRQFVDDLRARHRDARGRHRAPRRRPASTPGSIRDEDPRLLAYSVLTTVGWFAHFHRTGRLDLDVDELAAFVGRHIVCSLAVQRAGGPREPWRSRLDRRRPSRPSRRPRRSGGARSGMSPASTSIASSTRVHRVERVRRRGRACRPGATAQIETASTTAMTSSDRYVGGCHSTGSPTSSIFTPTKARITPRPTFR